MCRHLAGETEQELRLEAELLHLATSGRGSAGQQQQSLEDERLSEGRKISQSWLNAAERVTRKTSVVRNEDKNHYTYRKNFNQEKLIIIQCFKASVASLVISQRRRTVSENFAGVTVEKGK